MIGNLKQLEISLRWTIHMDRSGRMYQPAGRRTGTAHTTNLSLAELNDEKAMLYLPVCIYVFLAMVFGLLGNLLVLYIYHFRYKRTSGHYFVKVLAIYDLIACCFYMPPDIYSLHYSFTFASQWGCKFLRFTQAFTVTGSVIVLVEIAVDRYFKICKPLQAISLRKLNYTCLGGAVVALVLSAPVLILYDLVPIETAFGNTSAATECSVRLDLERTPFPISYTLTLFVLYAVSLVSLVVLYEKVWRTIRNRRRYRKSSRTFSTSIEQSEDSATVAGDKMVTRAMRFTVLFKRTRISRSTLVLFAVTIAFVLSYLPTLVVVVCRAAITDLKNNSDEVLEVTIKLFSRFFYLGNIANPIIYTFCNPMFRKDCRSLFLKLTCR